MKCFNHPDRDAVAVCKNCNKGLCIECAVEVENGIACKGKCEEEVKFMDKMIQRNKTILNRSAASYYRTSIIYVTFGVVFLIFGFLVFIDIPPIKYFAIVFGFVMFFAAILTLISGKRIKGKE